MTKLLSAGCTIYQATTLQFRKEDSKRITILTTVLDFVLFLARKGLPHTKILEKLVMKKLKRISVPKRGWAPATYI